MLEARVPPQDGFFFQLSLIEQKQSLTFSDEHFQRLVYKTNMSSLQAYQITHANQFAKSKLIDHLSSFRAQDREAVSEKERINEGDCSKLKD